MATVAVPGLGDAFTPHVEVGERVSAVADLASVLERVGINIADVPRSDAVCIEVAGLGAKELVLVVTTYARNVAGKFYVSPTTGEVAKETRRFLLEGVEHLRLVRPETVPDA